MPNDTIDEIEARWPSATLGREPRAVVYAEARRDIRTLIAYGRGRRVVEAARIVDRRCTDIRARAKANGTSALHEAVAALDTPTEQEPTE